MKKATVVIENKEYDEVDEGLFRAVRPFSVNIMDWTYDRKHIGYQAITDEYANNPTATILYISTTGTAAMKLIRLYNDLRKNGEKVGYIEGVPESCAMGEIYA